MSTDKAYERLVKTLKQSPSREWIEQYLDLVKEVIDLGRFENDDPRLVLSSTLRSNFPVTINRRYVLSGFRKGKPLVGFTIPYDFEDLSELISQSQPPEFRYRQWKPHPGEIAEKCPYFLAFEGFPKNRLTPKQKSAWKQAILAEMERCSKSNYKRFHDPLVYQIVVDLTFRNTLLNQVFHKQENDELTINDVVKTDRLTQVPQTTKTRSEVLRISGDVSDIRVDNIYPDETNPGEVFREGMVRQVLVNAYERDPKARQKCIDYYGESCSVCCFNFGDSFGDLGKGFIHVHHLRPLSEIAEEYEIDPIKDLRPVCPNCHAMLHRCSPPLGLNELQQLLQHTKSSSTLSLS
jgi:hypothetical protein